MLTMYLLYSHSIVILCLTLVSQPVLSRDTIGQAPISQPQHQLQRHLDQQEATSSSRDSSSNLQYYYYTRTRDHPSHLRVAEEVKNPYVDEVKHESRINGTKYEYYKSSHLMSYDELVYETIDKIFRHRLSPFYLHHYDQDDDKRRSSDPSRVSQESCARDLLYLVEKLPKRSLFRNPFASLDDDLSGGYHSVPPVEDEPLTPELTAFFDSYARQEAGLLRGNTYWTGSHDQCVNRHIFELIDSGPASTKEQLMSTNSGESAATQQHQDNARRRQEAATSKREQRQQVVSFRGRYCVAALKAPVWDKLIENKKTRARNYFKSERQFQEYSKLFRLQLGICLPDSCDSTALERHMDEIKLLAKSTLEPRFADYELIDLYCLPDETSPLRQWSGSAIGFIVLMTVWLAIILMATLADVLEIFDSTCDAANGVKQTEETSGSRLSLFVRLLSLRANYRKLMHVGLADEGDGEDDQKGSTTTTTTTTTTTGQDKKIFKEDAQQAEDDAKQQDLQPQEPHQEERTTTSSSATEATSTSTTDPARRPQIRVDLRFLNAFKALIMFWIINGHIMLLMIQTAKNILDSDALLNGLMHFLIGATFGVDLFFTMTGFLTAYLLFNSGHAYKMKPATWIYLSFHRYWRLAPMYLLAFWFSRSVVQSLGSGPLWDYGTSNMTFRGLCNSESWWYPLTLTSNLHGLFEECMITSWYISCDMQFWLVSPVFVYLLAKSPLNGWLVTILTIAGSSKVRYDAILADKSARYDELVQPRADIFMRVSHDLPALYTHPHHRISAYLIGLLAGHYVYMIKSGKWKSILTEDLAQKQSALSGSAENITTTTTKLEVKKLKKPTDNDGKSGSESSSINNDNGNGSDDDNETDEPITTTMTRELDAITSKTTTSKTIMMTRAQLSRRRRNTLAYLGLALFLIMASCSYLLANYFPSQYLKHSKPIAAIFYSLDHLAMSLGASLIIVTICLGQWHRVARFLSHPNWTRLSKINYALLLLQCEAIYFQIFRYEQVPLAGTRELINILFNLLVTLYPIAFMATLVFEFPLANLEKVAMKALVFGGRRSSGSGSNKKMN